MKTSATPVVLATALATACITVRQAEDVSPPGDAGSELDSGGAFDSSKPDVAALPNDTGTDAAPGCTAKGALGFCENFDEKDLPGAFAEAARSRGELSLVTAPVTSGSRALRSNIEAFLGGDSQARLYKGLPKTQEVEIEFDLLPTTLNTSAGPASAFVTQVQMEETGGGIVIGGVQIEASQGNGALFAMRYNQKGDAFQKVGSAVPVVVGRWKRLRFRFTRAGEMSLYDVSNRVDIAAPVKVPVPDSLKPDMAVTLGAECYVAQTGFSFVYDSVVVNAQ